MAGAGGAKPREESTETGLRAMRGVGGLGPSSSPPPPGGNWAKHPRPHPSVLQFRWPQFLKLPCQEEVGATR